MSDDDFMQESEEETYDFEYEDDGSDDDGDVDLENQYYNAKALKEDDPRGAIDALKRVVASEGDEHGDWGFKALKQICKVSFVVLDDKEACLQYYRQLLSYTKSAVTRNYSEKSLNNILDYVSTSKDTAFMELFYSTTLQNLAEQKNDRLWLKTNLKLAKLWLDRREYDRLAQIIKEMHAATTAPDDVPTTAHADAPSSGRDASLLEVYALEIQLYTETKDNKKLRELYDRTLRVRSSITHPRTMGVIRECGGKMHMYDKRWKDAQQEFFESFRSYDEAGSPERIQVLKYLVLANMLMRSEINPFDSQETKPYRDDPQITPMTTLVEAYQRNDIVGVETILKTRRSEIMGDPFVAQYVSDILKNIRTAVLLRLVAPYTRVNLGYVAGELGVGVDEVERLLVELILDGHIDGRLDACHGRLELNPTHDDRLDNVVRDLATTIESIAKQPTATARRVLV